MSEDITFCVNMRCKMQCERNPRNIRMYWMPHSFARFEECEYWDAPEEVTGDAAEGKMPNVRRDRISDREGAEEQEDGKSALLHGLRGLQTVL